VSIARLIVSVVAVTLGVLLLVGMVAFAIAYASTPPPG
jgi:hypothetical protein